MKNQKKIDGITLIALVVTIVVLIILATISINAVVGENGIIRKAQNAKEWYNNGVISEEEALNKLLEEYENMLESKSADLVIEKRGEDTITVRIEGNNIKDFQFSLDGTNWTDVQTSNAYTFTGLTKIVVDETNYKTETGTSYTIYGKAKTNTGTEIECVPIETSTVVEVNGNADYFTYTDLGDEILITGFKEDAFYDNEKARQGTIDPILIPSYINEKPVTKISTKLIMQNISEPVYSEQGIVDAWYQTDGTDETRYMNHDQGTILESRRN